MQRWPDVSANSAATSRRRPAWREKQCGQGMVQASGRRVVPVENGWRWFGIKAHATQVSLSADLEMHCLASGYVGISRLPDGQVNVCGLFRRRSGAQREPGSWHELLRGAPRTSLHQRLGNAVFDQRSFCSVGGLPLRPQRASSRAECCIGDAITMIAPVTGNGMSMAFEAADVAANRSLRTAGASWTGKQPGIEWQRPVIAPSLDGSPGGVVSNTRSSTLPPDGCSFE